MSKTSYVHVLKFNTNLKMNTNNNNIKQRGIDLCPGTRLLLKALLASSTTRVAMLPLGCPCSK